MSRKPRRIPILGGEGSYDVDLNLARKDFLLRLLLIIVWTVTTFLVGQGSTGKFCKDGWYKNMETGKLVKACVYKEEVVEVKNED